MNQIPMTRVGQELLKKELQQLKSIDRPMVIQAISEARAQGDLSENAEYDAAKEKQAFIEGRLAEIEAKLSHATVIDPASLNAEGKCVFGSTVIIEDLDNEKKSTYQIVGDDESDIKGNKISINSPLAKSLIGKEEGDVVEFESPGGVKSFEILKVQYI
jgi:transcription elongation factor GreA